MTIYKITNKINLKSYIGLTTKTVEIRWKKHVRDAVKAADVIKLSILRFENMELKILK
ncbi:MAG: GIY-YIG nuclease family protein [Leptolyngbyaceae cyanobacterium RM2_2_4]|nr:GIY-YIG nuclease family protein [Leptolyngbyaceae cyanobacterium RM2_2_4]